MGAHCSNKNITLRTNKDPWLHLSKKKYSKISKRKKNKNMVRSVRSCFTSVYVVNSQFGKNNKRKKMNTPPKESKGLTEGGWGGKVILECTLGSAGHFPPPLFFCNFGGVLRVSQLRQAQTTQENTVFFIAFIRGWHRSRRCMCG